METALFIDQSIMSKNHSGIKYKLPHSCMIVKVKFSSRTLWKTRAWEVKFCDREITVTKVRCIRWRSVKNRKKKRSGSLNILREWCIKEDWRIRFTSRVWIYKRTCRIWRRQYNWFTTSRPGFFTMLFFAVKASGN